MKKIVVIGGAGLIGSKLIALLTAQGHTPVAAAPPQPRSPLRHLRPERGDARRTVPFAMTSINERPERSSAMHVTLKSALVPDPEVSHA